MAGPYRVRDAAFALRNQFGALVHDEIPLIV